MPIVNGELVAYWEQGWEGRIEFAFQDAASTMPHFLRKGDRLAIYAEDGTTLWSGEIEWVRRRLWDRHRLDAGIWSYQKQRGVGYGRWLAWFWHKPPLKARLEVKA
ncbi:MAG: hypothetical protein H6654_09290 [Ardenticatenaceae bacterium]|nr:hypothetical protein [Anaerolineales bacterium]MCB8938606.1 hypothetical protein [Ardenticatenaceae bacterium]MCB8973739.1 hypothetical protein [Ardenticatenaceae bacterium]